MNPRVLILVTGCAIAAVCAYFFTSRDTAPSPGLSPALQVTVGGGSTGNNSHAAKRPGGKAGKVDWEFFATLDTGLARPAPTAEDVARFLTKHGETPANLIAAFEIAHERRWLDRALELFPNSPIVLMKAIEAAPNPPAKAGEKYEPDPERMALIERFKAADPNNPVPWFFAAQELFKSGPSADAVAEIRAALDRPAFYVYANERMEAAQNLYESVGLGGLEASTLAMFGLTLPHMSAANQTSRMLMEWQKSASGTGDMASSDEALRLTYSLGRTFATPEASRMLIGQLVGLAMEKRALEALPAEAQPAWLAVDPAQRLAEIEKQKQGVKEISVGLEQVIRSQDEEVLSEYLRRMRSDGEPAAFEWLKRQKK